MNVNALISGSLSVLVFIIFVFAAVNPVVKFGWLEFVAFFPGTVFSYMYGKVLTTELNRQVYHSGRKFGCTDLVCYAGWLPFESTIRTWLEMGKLVKNLISKKKEIKPEN